MKVKAFQIRLAEEFLQADQDKLNNFIENVDVRKTSTELANGKPDYWSVLVFYHGDAALQQEQKQEPIPTTKEKISSPAKFDLSEEEKKIYEALKQWRAEKAQTLNLPTYLVCSNAQLAAVAKIKPQSPEELIQIKGFGGQKTAKHGGDIIALLNSIIS